jgi:cytoskeletal protein CcmA (bactofilin family)
MPATQQDKVLVACPHCGHPQAEPRAAFSTVCRQCHRHFHVQEALKPTARPAERTFERRQVRCFDCGAELEVALTAESTMCKRCSQYVDLKDYTITNAVSKNFKTRGSFVVEPKGYVFNTEVVVGEAILKGKFHGKLVAEQSLTIYTTAQIKGSFRTGRLIIPAENVFHWKEPIKTGAAEIAGELVGDLDAAGTVVLKSSARLFGAVSAGHLIVESGAVVVGGMRIGANPT